MKKFILSNLSTVLFVFLILALLFIPSTPSNPMALKVYNTYVNIGFLILVISPVFINLAGDLSCTSLTGLAYRFLRNTTLFLGSVKLLGFTADDIYQQIIDKPNDALIIGIVIGLIVIFIIADHSISSLMHKPQQVVTSGIAAQTAVLAKVRKLSPKDIKYAAAHEAGHALAYAAVSPLPHDICIEIEDKYS